MAPIVQEYYDEVGESLTKTTDQTIEASHNFVEKMLRRSQYVVKDVTCDKHGAKLLRGLNPVLNPVLSPVLSPVPYPTLVMHFVLQIVLPQVSTT